eukprot:8713174-Alexandrium_andersonii.AAC.1
MPHDWPDRLKHGHGSPARTPRTGSGRPAVGPEASRRCGPTKRNGRPRRATEQPRRWMAGAALLAAAPGPTRRSIRPLGRQGT